MVCTLFPLAVGPSAEQLTFSGPGVLWVAWMMRDADHLFESRVTRSRDAGLTFDGVSAVPGGYEIAADADEATMEKAALEDARIREILEGKTIRKVIVVPGRLVNIVAN